MPVDRWNQEKLIGAVQAEVGRRMQRAVLVLQGDVQRKLSRGQPVRRSSGGALVGLAPSLAGEPPKVVSSRLRTSVTHDVRIGPREVVGRVGTNTPYGRRLELGFFGTDSRGRNYNQAARPHLRPALQEGLPKLLRILGAG